MKINTILDLVDLGTMALPEFQRGYVWNRDQVRSLMDSLYRRHPVGSLLVWKTSVDAAATRGDGVSPSGSVELLLDGQQRITTLYGIIRGHPPRFFDGNAQAFTGLHFNLVDESFEFYAPLKMRDNPVWIDVSNLMRGDVGSAMQPLMPHLASMGVDFPTCLNRLSTIQQITQIDFHVDQVTGVDKTIDVVVDIFNRVNSGGTKLTKGDLALAKICASWPEARDEMKRRLAKWEKAGFQFRLEWFLRCVNALVTGEAMLAALSKVDTQTFQQGVVDAERRVDSLLNLISSRLGLDHDQVLGSRYSLPLLVRYLDQKGGKLPGFEEQNQLLYWYVHSFLWGRYAGSTKSVLNQDLELVERFGGDFQPLINQLSRLRGDLRLSERDFLGSTRGARFYPLLYMLTRVHEARDWGSGMVLNKFLLGNQAQLHLHHIFPKALLRKHGYSQSEANALANFTFLTADTNLEVSDKDPSVYLPTYVGKHPGAVLSHWIPSDPELWKIENYQVFLVARRELLARASNDFLDGLRGEAAPPLQVAEPILERSATISMKDRLGSIGSEAEEQTLRECNDWVVEQGLPPGNLLMELVDQTSGAPTALLDLAWPYGLQEGLSQLVALLIDEDESVEAVANQAGFRFFTSVADFKRYVRGEVLALEFTEV